MTSVYVGNLSRSVTEAQLRTLFEAYGPVTSVKIIMDRFTGNPKGFAFVDLEKFKDADRAIEGLHDTELIDRNITVNLGRPQTYIIQEKENTAFSDRKPKTEDDY